MPALYAGKRVGKPLLNGHTYNAMFNGKLVWPLDKDTVVSIEITDDKGKPLPKSLAVSGTLKLGGESHVCGRSCWRPADHQERDVHEPGHFHRHGQR